ncbi:MAG: aspartate-semialdehyde dehydrogenase [bacterium]
MGFKTAVMGVTGAVGQEILNILDERDFPVDSLLPLASERSKGKVIKFKGDDIPVQVLDHDSFKNIDLVLSSAGGSISRDFVPSAVKQGAVVVDNTSYFRMHDDVPLVVPEVNPGDIKKHKGIIANPNCSTIIMVLPLFPIYKAFGIKRVVVSTYQAASGAGAKAMAELMEETRAVLDAKPYKRSVFPNQYAFNLFPHNSGVPDNDGYVQEEVKMIKETRKMFHDDKIRVSPTCVRVPVLRAHSETLNIELEKDASVEDIYKLMESAPGVKVLEDRKKNRWPMPVDASGKDPVFVGRIRKDQSNPNTVEMWIVGDQIRKGAALNAVQIAELL